MAPLPRDQDITNWLQLLNALAAAQFQITQLRARVHMLATSGPTRTVIP